jgi:hypothetical protein
MRSKWTVLVLLLSGMVLLFTTGVLWRVFRPDAADRVLRQVPMYPGAQAIELPPGQATGWKGYTPTGSSLQTRYLTPARTTRAEVFRFFRMHMPSDWRRVNDACYARGSTRVVVLPSVPARPTYDIVVDTGGVPCPRFVG